MIAAAASARLCVETKIVELAKLKGFRQPPPRGCVLKLIIKKSLIIHNKQPPPRGCVLKRLPTILKISFLTQPPPRGCVLKQSLLLDTNATQTAAASARLCVETLK